MNVIINEKKWLPTSINEIINSFSFQSKEVVKKNLAYNIQYLQYLKLLIENTNVTSVIKRMQIKSFIITSMSIIEEIFICLLRSKKLIPLIEWQEGKHKYNKIDDNTIEVTYLKKKKIPKEKKLTFDEAITLIEKNQTIKIIPSSYPVLVALKDLRNKLHLDKAKNCLESDYFSFNEYVYDITKLILFEILKLKEVSNNVNYAIFLK